MGSGRRKKDDREPQRGWVLLPMESVPPQWRQRATLLALVPLLPEEAKSVLQEGSAVPRLDAEEERLVRLVASGMNAESIAGELGVTSRSVSRRLARLRQRFGVDENSGLAAFLARRGF